MRLRSSWAMWVTPLTARPEIPLTHATSVHYIGRDYYWYDGMVDSGTLHQMEDAYQEAPAHMGDPQYVVYFRL